jgi:hypothetical protein
VPTKAHSAHQKNEAAVPAKAHPALGDKRWYNGHLQNDPGERQPWLHLQRHQLQQRLLLGQVLRELQIHLVSSHCIIAVTGDD